MNCPDCQSDKVVSVKHRCGEDSWLESEDCQDCGRKMIPSDTTDPNPRTPISYECPHLENTDPSLAEFFQQVASRSHPVIAGCSLTEAHFAFKTYERRPDGQCKWIVRNRVRRVEKLPGRNDPCHCGSNLKFKKCHGR